MRSATAVEREIEEKAEKYPNRRNATLGRRIFSRRGRPGRGAESPDVKWHSLEDLYA